MSTAQSTQEIPGFDAADWCTDMGSSSSQDIDISCSSSGSNSGSPTLNEAHPAVAPAAASTHSPSSLETYDEASEHDDTWISSTPMTPWRYLCMRRGWPLALADKMQKAHEDANSTYDVSDDDDNGEEEEEKAGNEDGRDNDDRNNDDKNNDNGNNEDIDYDGDDDANDAEEDSADEDSADDLLARENQIREQSREVLAVMDLERLFLLFLALSIVLYLMGFSSGFHSAWKARWAAKGAVGALDQPDQGQRWLIAARRVRAWLYRLRN
ncbi:hypothetical protein Dda_8885 [Drechslerella dactyloides]|uniref:Uncharacterized protein n=1 Tax=Drechslerella dactyloides TaxID=74499 RepID=A0AAD6IQ39_DREDA|nr:hypothetical protein Dda_8885 [Drechslerella dactyloides]